MILSEVASPLGVLLWEAYRDTAAWLRTPVHRRGRLFAEESAKWRRIEIGREVGPERIRNALVSLAAILADGGDADPDAVLEACLTVAAWADGRGDPATRLAFTQVAALASPADARLALEAGRQARDLAEYASAEPWLRKAVRAARRAKDWNTYLWSYAALAIQYERLGNLPASHALAERVLRTARHNRIRRMEGWAFHHFFVLAASAAHPREAYEHAQSTLRLYGAMHPRLTELAHDVARFCLDYGSSARALAVFEAVLPRIADPAEQVVAAANAARAAAAIGKQDTYEKARHLALTLQSRVRPQGRMADVYATLALADMEVGRWALAGEAAEVALAVAAERQDSEALRFAEATMQLAQARRIVSFEPARSFPTLAREADRLAGELIDTLRANSVAS